MTSQKSCSERPAAFHPRLFGFLFRRDWPQLLLYFLMLFFTHPIPVLLASRPYYYSANANYWVDLAASLGVASVVVSSVIALFAGCSSLVFLNSRPAVNYWHSLPVRREAIYFATVVVRCIYFLISLLTNTLLGVLFIAIRGEFDGTVLFTASSYVLQSMVFFALFYFITLFAASMTGTSMMRFSLTIATIFLPLGVYSVAVLIFAHSAPNLCIDYYFGWRVLKYLCPPVRITQLYDYPLQWREAVVYLVMAAVLSVLALILYMKRKSERSGEPIVYGTAAGIYKYALIIVCTYYCGLLFSEMQSLEFWLYFGFAVGGVLTFMIANTVIYKTARAMFRRGWGLAVYFGCFLAIFIVFGYDLPGLNNYVPSAFMTSHVTAEFDDVVTDYSDRGVIDMFIGTAETSYKDDYLKDLYNNFYDYNGAVADVDINQNNDYEYIYVQDDDILTLEIVFHTRIGIPVAKRVRVYRIDAEPLLRAIADGDEYEKAFNGSALDVTKSPNMNAVLPGKNNTVYSVSMYYYNEEIRFGTPREIIFGGAEYIDVSFDMYQNPTAAVRGANYYYTSSPYADPRSNSGVYYAYANDKDTISRLCNALNGLRRGDLFDGSADLIDTIAANAKVTVYDRDTEQERVYTDMTEIRSLLGSCASVCVFSNSISDFAVTDPRYVVKITLNYRSADDKYIETYEAEAVEGETTYDENGYYNGTGDIYTRFLAGRYTP